MAYFYAELTVLSLLLLLILVHVQLAYFSRSPSGSANPQKQTTAAGHVYRLNA